MISSLLHLVGLQPRVHYTLTNFRGGGGGGQGPLGPPQYANGECIYRRSHAHISCTASLVWMTMAGVTMTLCLHARSRIRSK